MKGKWKKWIHITYVTKLSCALLKEEQFPTASRSRRNHSDTYSSPLNKYGGTLIHLEKITSTFKFHKIGRVKHCDWDAPNFFLNLNQVPAAKQDIFFGASQQTLWSF